MHKCVVGVTTRYDIFPVQCKLRILRLLLMHCGIPVIVYKNTGKYAVCGVTESSHEGHFSNDSCRYATGMFQYVYCAIPAFYVSRELSSLGDTFKMHGVCFLYHMGFVRLQELS